MSYPDTPDMEALVTYLEEHGFKHHEEPDGSEYWLGGNNDSYLLDDNSAEPDTLALSRMPVHPHEAKGMWVEIHQGSPANMLTRLQEEFA